MREEHHKQLKSSSVGHSLIKAARLYNELMIGNFRTRIGVKEIQAYHLSLFAHISLDGSTINEIAKKAQISKQAVSKTVAELVDMKALKLKENPKDKRSKLVYFPETGEFTLEKGLEYLSEQDHILQDILGNDQFAKFKESLDKIIARFESDKD